MAASGCARTFSGEAVQPNPLRNPTETLPMSEEITIVRGDMELDMPEPPAAARTASVTRNHKYPLINQASFTIVSRDRLRFHVQIDHKWQEWADLNTWTVKLEDDKGRHWTPEAIEGARTKILTTMWDREKRTAVCNSAGRDGTGNCYSTIGYRDDGWRNRQTLGSLSVFRGKADFTFYQRDLMNRDVRVLKLTVSRPGEAFEFTWNFADHIASAH
ncbi:MAG: hypothetical protein ACKV2T_36180 [Kofleriaceae bacterium]